MDKYFTIIIPAYNAEKTIHNFFELFELYECEDLEVIIVDDGSTDDTYNVLTSYQKKYSDCVKIYKQVNSGPNVAREYGINKSSGKYILFCDADDYFDYGKVLEIKEIISKTNYDIYEFGYRYVYSDKSIKEVSFADEYLEGDNVLLRYVMQKKSTNFLWNKCFKRELFKNIEFVRLFAAEDSCDLIQVFGKANTYLAVSQVVYNYVQTPNSLCRSDISLRRLDEIKGDKFKLAYIENRAPYYKDYIIVQAIAHCAFLYGKIKGSNLTSKENALLEITSFYDELNAKFHICSKAYWNASIKRKLSIIIFEISPKLYCKIIR